MQQLRRIFLVKLLEFLEGSLVQTCPQLLHLGCHVARVTSRLAVWINRNLKFLLDIFPQQGFVLFLLFFLPCLIILKAFLEKVKLVDLVTSKKILE